MTVTRINLWGVLAVAGVVAGGFSLFWYMGGYP